MSVSTSVTARRMVAAALAAGALVGSASVSASAADPRFDRSHVAISRVQSNAPGFDDRSARSLNAEWVEITNSNRRSVNLNGWTLSDEDGNRYTFHHYYLAGRSTVRVHTGYGRDTSRDVYQDRRAEVWDNRSDTATLRTERGRFVDNVSWGWHHDRDHGRDDKRGNQRAAAHPREPRTNRPAHVPTRCRELSHATLLALGAKCENCDSCPHPPWHRCRSVKRARGWSRPR